MTHPALVSYRSKAWPWILVLPFDHVIGQEISLHSITNEKVIFPALSYTHFIYLDLSLAPRDDYFKSDLLWYHSYLGTAKDQL